MNKNQKGFSAVEALLLLVIVGMLGGVGWYVWHAQKQADKTYSQTANSSAVSSKKVSNKTSPAATDPYAGWKNFTTQNVKVGFEYPASWTVKDSSSGSDDVLQLTGSDGFTANISFGTTGHPSLDYDPQVLYAQEAMFNGKFDENGKYAINSTQEFIDYIGGTPSQAADGLVYGAQLSKSKTKAMDTPEYGKYGVNINGKAAKAEPLTDAKVDVNYKNLVLIISTLHAAH
jgi:type II secretory pathway pseudopilin PulG